MLGGVNTATICRGFRRLLLTVFYLHNIAIRKWKVFYIIFNFVLTLLLQNRSYELFRNPLQLTLSLYTSIVK